ncbi:unnamed protein product [Moneuplotes crassus]|uniref:Uncharacterized protein n=1 Tax=Euplotes crassus TaxID=5936 RepID=A0AAD2D8V4_EUPCR|nr:unnamed protein product [Moneuplotes crassus]
MSQASSNVVSENPSQMFPNNPQDPSIRTHHSQRRIPEDMNGGPRMENFNSSLRQNMGRHQTHHSHPRGGPEMSREQMNESQAHIYDASGRILPPLSYFRKQNIFKLLMYGIKEEQGEISILRRQLFRKYKSALYKLMNRLEYERKMLVRQEMVIRGRDPEKALENSAIMNKNVDEKYLFSQLIPDHVRNRKRTNPNLEDSYKNNGRTNPPNPAEVGGMGSREPQRESKMREGPFGNVDNAANQPNVDKMSNYSRSELLRNGTNYHSYSKPQEINKPMNSPLPIVINRHPRV